MKPKLSIIIPCYGGEKYLDRCMNTIVNQTLKDIEIILIDDGSPDKVPQMCDEWAKKDSRIIVIHKENGGLGFARNSGLNIARGGYVAFVDSDDYVDVSMYNSLMLEAEKSGADAVFCKFYKEQVDGTWTDRKEVADRTEWKGMEIHDFILDIIATAPYIKEERKYSMSVWHSIYRREIIDENKIQFYSERDIVSEDIPFQVDFLLKSKKIVYLPLSYYYYCLNGESLTCTFNHRKYERMKSLFLLLNTKLDKIRGYQLRTDKFFIGYVRSFMLSMFNSDYQEKGAMVRKICDDIIWKEISKRYKPSFLSLYPRLIYNLIIHKQVKSLLLIFQIVCFIKKAKGIR